MIILRDGIKCTDCYNFTALDADPVIFNVTSWSNYSIGSDPDATLPNVTYVVPTPDDLLTTNSQSVVVNASITPSAITNSEFTFGNSSLTLYDENLKTSVMLGLYSFSFFCCFSFWCR